MDTRCIEEDDLGIVSRENPEQPIARGLRFWGDDADLLPQERVDECRFADVGAANHRHKARTKVVGECGFLRPAAELIDQRVSLKSRNSHACSLNGLKSVLTS